MPTKPTFPLSWRGKAPGFAELSVVLNLVSDAAIVIDTKRGQVLSVNPHFLKLTAFTLAEILNISSFDLFPEKPIAEIPPGAEIETILIRRNRDALPVIVRAIVLDANNQWLLMVVVPVSVYQQNQVSRQRQEQLYLALRQMAELSNQADIKAGMEMATRIGRQLFEANIICLYQADSEFPQLSKVASIDSPENALLPDVLPSSELIRLQEPSLWTAGKRVVSDLHRIARVASLSYLASVPLGHPGAWTGLLVAADTQAPLPEKIMILLEILAANITTALDQSILVSNLQRDLERLNSAVSTHMIISENAGEGIILTRPDLTILDMNPSAELMLGYAGQEVIGEPVDKILIGTEAIGTALKSAVEGIPTHNLGNINLHRRSGSTFAAHAQTIPVTSTEEFLGVVILLSDVSENEQIRVRTQQLEQRAVLGEVTAIFAHEVRNPINNISTGLQLMAMNLAADHPNQELIGRLQHDCNRLTHLMESVLSFSRPQEYKMVPMSMDELLKRILDRWNPRLTRVNVQPYFQAEPDCPQISGDARALEQVFTNLISNAVQAMSSTGGTLSVKISKLDNEADPPQVEVTVSDDGPGIPDEIRDHIFEPFVTTNPQGTGLGLAITKRIVTAHKGNIYVNSFPGGTVFHVSLPSIQGVAA
ncbi:MAG TPA: ATP-binding protein [Anaerolineaceae bacterium]|nr:ATP-binding protein [Anaerolineaceae bacterium]